MVAPFAIARSNADSVSGSEVFGVAAVDGNQVAGQVVLATKRPSTRLVVASVRLQTIGIMRLDMRLQVVGAGESCVGKAS